VVLANPRGALGGRITLRGRQASAEPAGRAVFLEVVREFFATCIFGPDRAARLAAQIPASAAEAAAQAEKKTAALRQRLHQIDTAENAHAREIEALAHLEDPYAPALRSRTLARFTELEAERGQIDKQLADLAKTAPTADDLGLLDTLPVLGDILDGAPIRLQQHLYEIFDLQLLYKSDMHQVSIHAAITDRTAQAIMRILQLDGPDPGQTTSTPGDSFSDLTQHPRAPPNNHDHGNAWVRLARCWR
jgi:hypothetical protein